jgi:hypothetical protein
MANEPHDLKDEDRETINEKLKELEDKGIPIKVHVHRMNDKITALYEIGDVRRWQSFEDDDQLAENICTFLDSARRLSS